MIGILWKDIVFSAPCYHGNQDSCSTDVTEVGLWQQPNTLGGRGLREHDCIFAEPHRARFETVAIVSNGFMSANLHFITVAKAEIQE